MFRSSTNAAVAKTVATPALVGYFGPGSWLYVESGDGCLLHAVIGLGFNWNTSFCVLSTFKDKAIAVREAEL